MKKEATQVSVLSSRKCNISTFKAFKSICLDSVASRITFTTLTKIYTVHPLL